ncbi:MAG: hypothetical protein Q8Q20_03790, partial [bacterium]|nr:hypothetical protein [bacterium]
NSQVNGNTNAATDPDEVGTSGWLTYTNEEYGYSFMYPLDSSVKENRISRELFSYFSAFFSLQTTNSYSTGIDVRTYESLSDLANGEDYETLDDWIAAHEGNLYEYRETSRLDGRKTFEGEEGGAYQHYSLYTEVDGKIFEIAFTWEYPDERIVDKDSQNILLNDEELGFLESFHLTDV